MKKKLLLLGFLFCMILYCIAQSDNDRIVYINCNEKIDQHYLSLPSTKIFDFNEIKDLKIKDSIYYLVINYKECAEKDYYSQLKEFKNIEIVRLIGNFQSIPKELFQCKKVQQLNIFFNNSGCFDKIFEDASKIRNLKTLRIYNSYIGIFPESIKYLKKIENFHIKNSDINGFGNHFIELTNLKTLLLNNCGLHYLPDDYINPNLTCLDISNNQFDDLPEEILNFENLEIFRYFYNYSSVKSLNYFCLLKKLKYLYLGHLGVESIPDELLCIENLEFLLLSNTIYNVDNILHFPHLKVIDISGYVGDYSKLKNIRKQTETSIISLPSPNIKQ